MRSIILSSVAYLVLQYFLLLTYSIVQSLSWEVNWFAASQEIPRISRNPKVHYRTHKRPPPVSILGQPNPVHILTSHLLEICPNIIHPSTPRSPQWSLSLRFPHQDPIQYFLLSSHKWHDFRQKIIESKMCVLISSSELSEILFILLRNQGDFTLRLRWTTCDVSVTVVKL